MATPINTIYSWFETGDFPTQAQFQASWSSFWHKDELIPFGRIDGLGGLFENTLSNQIFYAHLDDPNAHSYYLAKKDASNLTPANVNLWKVKLGVGDLPENIATYDYEMIDHVMMKDGTTKEATDLGKNIANSACTSIAGAGMTLGAPYVWNTASQPYSITNLPDKSADATYNRMLVQDAAGNVAKSNGKELFKAMPANLSEAEKNAWKTQMNGGWTTNSMSVIVITPIVISNANENSWVSIKGVNLNFNPTSFSVKIVALDGVTVIATVPNSQVQLYQNGLDLTFYFNFSVLPLGEYKLKLWNGVAEYVTNISFYVADNIDNVILNGVIWDKIYYNGAASSAKIFSSGAAGQWSPDVNLKALSNYDNSSIIGATKSSEIIGQNQDFFSSFNINTYADANQLFTFGLGFCLASASVNLLDQLVGGVKVIKNIDSNYDHSYINDNNISFISTAALQVTSAKVYIMRRGSLWTFITQANESIVTYSKSGTSDALSLYMFGSNAGKATTGVGWSIEQIYKF